MLKRTRLATLLLRWQSNVLGKSILVAGCMFISDYFWAKYISTVALTNSIAAANYGVAVVVLGAYVVVSYVEDKRLIVPAAIGAWLGTYYGV